MTGSHYPGVAVPDPRKPDFLSVWMPRWYGLLQAHRVILTAVLLLLGGVLFTASNNIVWQTSLLSFFSAQSAAIHDVRLSESRNGLADAMRLDVHFLHGHPGHLGAAVQLLAHALQNTHAFSTLWYGASERRQIQAQIALRNLAPVLLSRSQLHILQHRMSSPWLDRHFRRQVEQMAGPAGQWIAAQLQSDPLNTQQLLLARLKSLSPGSGTHFSGPVLVSGNNRHAMMILAPPFKPQNVAQSQKMLAIIRAAIRKVKKKMPALRVWIVGPYRNFVENQRRVKRDLKIISIVGTLLVAGVIAMYFRRIGAVVVCLIPPMVGLGAAMGIAGLFRLHIPLIVLGFDGLLCGATTDYGIQLMAAMNRMARREGRFDNNMPARAARELFGPISMSVCTSMTGYAALAASSAPGLQALGLFIAGATGCIWMVTFIVLPAYLGPWVCRSTSAADNTGAAIPPGLPAINESKNSNTIDLNQKISVDTAADINAMRSVAAAHRLRNTQFRPPGQHQSKRPGLLKIAGTVAFILITVWLATRALSVGYTANGQSLDGSSAALKHDQARFAQVWGHLRQSGVITIHQSSAGKALSELHTLDRTLAILKVRHLIAGYTTPSAILPDGRTARRRMAAWRAFWTPDEIKHAQWLLDHAATTAGLRSSAFAAAIKSWQSPGQTESALRRLQQSPATLFPGVVQIRAQGVSISSTVQLNASLSPKFATQWASDARHVVPGISIICGQVLYLNASYHARTEAQHLFPWVALLIVIPLWIFFRRLDVAAIAALSLGIGFIWLLGVAQWWGGGLNLLSLVPMLFTMGVAVDYGIYAASDPALQVATKGPETRNSATFLCAATTILGTAAMILASHPVLHWIGITLTAGILGGYLSSYFIVRPLVRMVLHPPASPQGQRMYRMALRAWRGAVLLAMLILLAGALGGCCTVPPPLPYHPPLAPAPTVSAAQKSLAAFPRRWNKQFFANVNWHGHPLSMIGQVKGQSLGTLRVTCASEFGTLLFDARVSANKPRVLHTAAAFPQRLARYIALDTTLALRLPAVAGPCPKFIVGHHTLSLTDHHMRDTFAGAAGYLRVCHIHVVHMDVEIQYQQYHNRAAPHTLLIWDAGHCLLLTLNFDSK